MDKNLDFIYQAECLEVSFRVLDPRVPAKAIFSWDFGDSKGIAYNQKQPTYTYEKSGFYPVTLTITSSDGSVDLSATKVVLVNILANTNLSNSIYVLIDKYIPSEINQGMTLEDKKIFINKWQLYIGPLVNHEIPDNKITDELYYEGLENQLIMELAVWDFATVTLTNLILSTGEYLSQLTSTKETTGDGESEPEKARGDRIKQITTGPTEVQYYDKVSESVSSLYKAYTTAAGPNGILEELKRNLCILASRLDIFLPFCDQPNTIVAPKVVNHRRPGLLSGPNPGYPVKRNKR